MMITGIVVTNADLANPSVILRVSAHKNAGVKGKISNFKFDFDAMTITSSWGDVRPLRWITRWKIDDYTSFGIEFSS